MPATKKIAIDILTPREREVLRLIADGLSTEQIALILNISPKTVGSHRTSLRQKLHTTNVTGLIRFALQFKLIK